MTQGVDSGTVDPPDPSPVRTCVGCRARATKVNLLRVVVSGDEVVTDPQGLLPGRGAYLHPNRQCWELAVRRRAVHRALRVAGQISLDAVAGVFTAQG